MPIRLVERSSSSSASVSSHSSFSVSELENTKNDAHASAWESATCGIDQWFDNHYALQQYRIPVDEFATALMESGDYWHCNKDGIGNLDLYAVEPTGDVVQLNGDITDDGRTTLRELGCFNTSNILFHLCSEGRCGEKWIVNDDGGTLSTSTSSSTSAGTGQTGDTAGDAPDADSTSGSTGSADGAQDEAPQ